MHRRHTFDSLYLYNYGTGDNQIHSEAAIQPQALVDHGQWLLPYESQPSEVKFVAETLHVGRFQQSWPERPMNFDSGANNSLGNFSGIHFADFSAPSASLRLIVN